MESMLRELANDCVDGQGDCDDLGGCSVEKG